MSLTRERVVASRLAPVADAPAVQWGVVGGRHMDLADVTLLVHAATTWYLVGTVWFGQLLHFSLFEYVGEAAFPNYLAAHVRSFAPAIFPVLGLNVISLGALIAGLRPAELPIGLVWLALALVLITGADTGLLVVPRLIRLGRKREVATMRSLVRVHWIRTASQTGSGGLVLVMLGVVLG